MAANANQSAVTSFLAGKGLSPAAIAGIEGNLKVESNFDPTNHSGDSGTSWGLAQWHLGRRDALVNYAQARGKAWTDLPTQLDYLWSELNGPYRSTLTALQQPGISPAQAATVFDKKFEGSTASSLPQRVSYAQQIAAGGTLPASGGPTLVQSGVVPAGLLSGAGGILGDGVSAVASTLGSGVSSVAGSAIDSAAKSDAVKSLFFRGFAVLFAGGLITLGLYKAFSPSIKNAAGQVSTAAGSAAKLAAL